MHYANSMGLNKIVDRLDYYFEKTHITHFLIFFPQYFILLTNTIIYYLICNSTVKNTIKKNSYYYINTIYNRFICRIIHYFITLNSLLKIL